MNKPISMLARVNSVYDSHVSWTCVRRSWVDLRCTIGVSQDPIFFASSSGSTNFFLLQSYITHEV